jgi:hypothetical protein
MCSRTKIDILFRWLNVREGFSGKEGVIEIWVVKEVYSSAPLVMYHIVICIGNIDMITWEFSQVSDNSREYGVYLVKC